MALLTGLVALHVYIPSSSLETAVRVRFRFLLESTALSGTVLLSLNQVTLTSRRLEVLHCKETLAFSATMASAGHRTGLERVSAHKTERGSCFVGPHGP